MLVQRQFPYARPQPPFALDQDLAQDLGVVMWFPLLPVGVDMGPYGAYGLTGTTGSITPTARPRVNLGSQFDGSSAQYVDLVPLTAPPITLAAWAYSTSITAAQDIIGIGRVTDANVSRFSLGFGGATAGDPIRAITQLGASAAVAVTSTGYAANQVIHAAATFTSSSSRAAYIDGGSVGTNTTSVTPSALVRTVIGATYQSSAVFQPLSGAVFDALVCNKVWTDAQVAFMANYRTAWSLYWQPGRRVFFDVGAAAATAARAKFLPLLGTA